MKRMATKSNYGIRLRIKKNVKMIQKKEKNMKELMFYKTMKKSSQIAI